ncbi:MAG: hypothetical protein KDC70_15375 [Saprospiraceae bacterium]|nr:hypothetical protein [Saprospiraceae bacterium]
MRTSPLIALALCFLSASAISQTCNCPEQFDWLRGKIALNYAGFQDKVTAEKQAEFDAHTAAFQEQVAAAGSDTACLRLLRAWTKWFHDGHVQIYPLTPAAEEDPEQIRARFAQWEKKEISEAQAHAYLDVPGRDSVEGIYETMGGTYRVAVLRDTVSGREFAAYILRADGVWWMPGQLKFELVRTAPGQYSSRVFLRDHSERSAEVSLNGGILRFQDLGNWYRQYPGEALAAKRPAVYTLNSLDDHTLLLRVPTMNASVRLELDSLITANKDLLARTPRLIIDCRDNGGGSDITFYPLRPYVYTGPARGYHFRIYATADNIEKYAALGSDRDYPKKQRRGYKKMAKKLRKQKGRMYGFCEYVRNKPQWISPNPKKVAILIDGGCASSCEQFLFYARQSKRVTLIGTNTAGIADYGNLHHLNSPGEKFVLYYPTARSCRIDAGEGIDGVGIPPDVRIEDEKTDWVEFARAYLARD